MPVSGSGSLFTLKNVTFPATVKTKTLFKITGEVKLFGIPFIFPVWVIATVIYPKQWWELMGSPKDTQTTMAIGGKFTIQYDAGFDREGDDFKLDVNLYAGPEGEVSGGVFSSVSTTIPPFPPVSSIPQQTFKVSGTGGGTGQEESFQIDNPAINPTTVEIGKLTKITVPVKNIGTKEQSITVKVDVTEMGATSISPPGSTVESKTFGPYTLAPGASQNSVWDWIAMGAAKGKWLVVGVYINNVLAKNTGPNNPAIFKQQFEVTSPQMGFQLGDLVINPDEVMLGKKTSLTFDVVNNSSNPQAVKLHADITEMGWTGAAPPGSIVDSYDNTTTIQPGDHWNPSWEWTAKGATEGKWVVVSLKDSTGNLLPNTAPTNPQIYKQKFEVVEPTEAASITLSSPSAMPNLPNIGDIVTIAIPFVLKSATAQEVKLVVTTQFAGTLTSAIDEETKNQTVMANSDETSTAWFTFNVTDGSEKGAVYSNNKNERKVKVMAYIAESLIAEKTFSAVYYAVKQTAAGVLTKISVGYSDPVVGYPLKATINVKNTGTAPITPSFRLDIKRDEGLFTQWQEGDGVFTVFPAIPAGQTVTLELYCRINTPYDWAGVTTMCAQVVLLGQGGSWDYKNNITVQGSATQPSLIASYSGGIVSYALSGFQPNANISVYVVGGGGLNVTSDNSGSYSGNFQVNPQNTGNFTLRATDNYGHTADATFTVTAEPGIYTLTVNVVPAGSGSVSINPDKAKYAANEVVTLVAIPATGYKFDKWIGVDNPNSNYTTVVMNGSKTVTLYFVRLSTGESVSISQVIPAAGYSNVVKTGDWISIGAYVANTGSSLLYVTVYFKTYAGSAFSGHGDLLHESGAYSKELSPGESFFFSTGYFENVYSDRYDVGVEVYNSSGTLINSREDDDVYYGSH